jgi:hypothetical protein
MEMEQDSFQTRVEYRLWGQKARVWRMVRARLQDGFIPLARRGVIESQAKLEIR